MEKEEYAAGKAGGKEEEEKKKNRLPTREGLREALKLFSYIRPYLGWFLLAQVFLIISTLTALAPRGLVDCRVNVAQRRGGIA